MMCAMFLMMFPHLVQTRSTLKVYSIFSSQRAFVHNIRAAKMADISHIDACNRAYLPENYQSEFFEDHIKRWAELALVAVNDKDELMGYALGRIEELLPRRSSYDYLKYEQPSEYIGHLASIATHAQFRGQGVAQALMRRMHFNMARCFSMDKVNLFCRVSNKAALSLYRDQLGYVCDRTVSRYYPDGEDAHMMLLTGLQAQLLVQQEDEEEEQHHQGQGQGQDDRALRLGGSSMTDKCADYALTQE